MNDGKQNMHRVPALGTQKIGADGKARVCCLSQARAVSVLSTTERVWEVASGKQRSNTSKGKVVGK